MVQDALNNFVTLYKQGQDALGARPLWLRAQQEHGWERFARLGLPSRKHEDWKYTSLAGLTKKAWRRARPDPSLRQQLAPYLKADAVNLVFNNGVFDQMASDPLTSLPVGMRVRSWAAVAEPDPLLLADAAGPDPLLLAQLWRQGEEMSDNGFIALNDAMLQEGLIIEVPKGSKASCALHLLHVHSAPAAGPADHQTAATTHAELAGEFLRHMIVVEQHGELSLWESFVSPAPGGRADGAVSGMTNAVVDIHLGAGARLYHNKLQATSVAHDHLAHVRVWQEEASHYEAFNLSVGGRLARHSIDLRQAGRAANSILRGLYLGRGKQQSEQCTALVHAAEHGRSEQYYKGIFDEAARGVFLGKVQVARDAQKIAARQLNKNLLLSSTAEADTKPVLEIDADDVKCSHGATVSQLRDDELYYLESRGIRPLLAKAMLARGFADELLFALEEPEEAAAFVKAALDHFFGWAPADREKGLSEEASRSI